MCNGFNEVENELASLVVKIEMHPIGNEENILAQTFRELNELYQRKKGCCFEFNLSESLKMVIIL